ncbi:WAT1-related protein [Dichanthelium oligosanthes]|uniref:WAT1-related protein n=1 Tax=Dichanthelium oligosanthes TaxID=888268 RepID=A0A1E5UZY9_9POAL|nr:WAT1-related protein [Dichanthelium oligosanthes]
MDDDASSSKKAYAVAITIQLVYTGMFVISKAAFDHGINTYVFIFYRQAAGSLLLFPLALLRHRSYGRSMSSWMLFKLFICALLGITFSLNLYHVSLKFTSATVASAKDNSLPADGTCEAEDSLWIVLQAAVLKECPDKILVTAAQCVFSTVQSICRRHGRREGLLQMEAPLRRQLARHLLRVSNPIVHPIWRTAHPKQAPIHTLLARMQIKGRRMKKKAYAVAMVTQVIVASTIMISKAAFDRGLSPFVYIFYRLAAASLFLTPLAIFLERRRAPPMSVLLLAKMFLYALVGNTVSLSLYNVSLKYTSATVASAMSNSIPVITFFLALLLRMEVIKMRSSSGFAKTAGIALCLAGVLVMALYASQSLSPLNRHGVLARHGDRPMDHGDVSDAACLHSMVPWIVFQGLLLKEYPNKLLATLIQCLFGMIQSCLVAVVVERDHPSRWKLGLDLSLLAVAYSVGIVGTGVCLYLQTWCVGMEGPVFLAMWNPLSLLLTVLCSSLLGEAVYLGRHHHCLFSFSL